MPRPQPHIDIDDLVRLYEEGATIGELRKRFGCRDRFIVAELRKLGLPTDRRRKQLDNEEIVRLYEGGMTKKGIAELLGVGAMTISKRLEEHGIMTESRSNAMRTRLSRMTAEQRQDLSRAAHEAVRGMKRSHEDLCRRAASKAAAGKPGSIEEARLGEMLRARGISVSHQACIDKYNIDLLVEGAIAVEVSGRPKKGMNAERIPKRVEHILDSGLAMLLVWSNTRWFPITEDVAEYAISLLDLVRRDPSALGKYWVVWGDGKVMAEACPYSDDLPFVLSPVSRRGLGT